MTVVPHFVPESEPDANSLPASPHPRPYFLYVGRLEKIKGVDSCWRISAVMSMPTC